MQKPSSLKRSARVPNFSMQILRISMKSGDRRSLRSFSSEVFANRSSRIHWTNRRRRFLYANYRLTSISDNMVEVWGCGAAGSALAWHARGQGFESPQLHQQNMRHLRVSFVFTYHHQLQAQVTILRCIPAVAISSPATLACFHQVQIALTIVH